MNQAQINEILKLNEAFYEKAPFSNTRRSYWKGWGRAVEVISFNDHSTINVLDVGCGNGRFLRFLKERLPASGIKYTGLDNNGGMLKEARSNYPDGDFLTADILEKIPEGKFDLSVCFGVTHHIPGRELRDRFFHNIAETVKPEGYLIITFWNFDTKKAVEKLDGANDFLLGWDNTPDLKRYCHLYSDEEMTDIKKGLAGKGFSLISSFTEDASNIYFVFRKVDTIRS
ncbi:MAG: Methyltransferase protein [uncultured bacterium]|uniref:Class I SAM-dependent methyltransferase n=1 Tax=candidate division WWE3 bacterium TaxID=2053526 RepID=A0A656PNA3_UNCKA|nr:hypothetical protein P147_WWE3C00001G0370 [candidate division WWE3 bacterium RAAC2_WWE3_1]EKD94994.1 MAG: Methyltransferase protein [uncultured bacterium]KKS29718.1 MAG: hypothetical protein UU91_C0004G0110 [candidate division WWE3 bacterium GW2011_GWB1_42_117]KKS55528.1 MAG: hypothetical protein UV21_C0001G0110 [candidate division WWE3 bacterium GW2011_GWD2_42_34]KKT06013.1 MAG: hypothetical protein UV83_C0001G0331 [candidate division WWE3 bacterium GW2011_GWE2_43_18]KKT06931.1 MAG: hypoth